MFEDELFDESLFPPKEDFENSAEWAVAIEEAMLNKWNRTRGGEIPATLEEVIAVVADIYAYTNWFNKFVLSPKDISDSAYDTIDGLIEAVASSITKSVGNRLGQLGWIRVSTNFCFSNSEWGEFDTIYVRHHWRTNSRSVMPHFSTVKSETDAGLILSTHSLSEFAHRYLTSFERVDSVADEVIEAYVAAIELRMDRRGWVFMEAQDEPLRLWIEPDEAFKEHMRELGENVEISYDDLRDHLFDFIRKNSPRLEEGTEIDPNRYIDKFHKKIREREWVPIHYEGETTWYRTEQAQRKVLEKLINEFQLIFERPGKLFLKGYGDDLSASSSRRDEAFQFFRKNREGVVKHEFYDSDAFEENLELLEAYLDTDSQIERMDGAETAVGYWSIEKTENVNDKQNEDDETLEL